MFKDMDISKELSEGFHKTPKYASQIGTDVEFNVNVLTVAHWPSYPVLELNLPPEFSGYQQTWLDYYSSKHSGRKITWALSIGHCLVHYLHPKGNKDLVLSLYQTIVLLLFNDKDSLTAEEIQKSTNLDMNDLERTLQSLSLGKVKILKKKPHTRNVLATDVLSVNPEFTHPSRRIVVNSIQASETQKEVVQTTEKVFEDRIPAVEACIVRIMKGKKTCSFKALVARVFEAMKFPMEVYECIDID
jgi:cullin-4